MFLTCWSSFVSEKEFFIILNSPGRPDWSGVTWVHLSLPPQCWDYKCIVLSLTFLHWVLGNQTQGPQLSCQAIYRLSSMSRPCSGKWISEDTWYLRVFWSKLGLVSESTERKADHPPFLSTLFWSHCLSHQFVLAFVLERVIHYPYRKQNSLVFIISLKFLISNHMDYRAKQYNCHAYSPAAVYRLRHFIFEKCKP